ncbi:MAG TPA: hypothetical protein VE338_02380, partial [Ktedonobacterales bacterium]|nr:hypothetical protein [Ktedonobacterales bacterium]
GGVVSSVRWAQADGRFASATRDTAQVIADTVIRGLLPASTAAPPTEPPTEPPTRKVPSAVGASASADD